jgi:ribonuclease HI
MQLSEEKTEPERKKPTKIEVFFDGACEPFNPGGVATWGFVVMESGKVIKKECGRACEPYTIKSTNNYAEYTALIKALEYCIQKGYSELTVKGDSQLVIRQITGEYSVRSEKIIPLYKKAISLAYKFKKIHFVWVRRESNEIADNLSKQAYISYIKEHKEKMVMPFGKFRGKPIAWVAQNAKGYLEWLLQQNIREELKQCIQSYL